jgi:hypothetical protein
MTEVRARPLEVGELEHFVLKREQVARGGYPASATSRRFARSAGEM